MSDDGKYKGKVKWYSIRKAWGYVTPTSADAPQTDDIFFHQTSINSEDKNKWLDTGYEVEFTVYKDDEGRYKCKTVSAADGSPCVIPKRPNRKRGKGGAKEGAKEGEGEKKEEPTNGEAAKKVAARGGRQPRKRFDSDFSNEIKEKMKAKKFDMRQTSLLVTVDKTRLKFGPEGYAALASADGILAEGTFACDDKGEVTLTWKKMLKYEGEEWKSQDAKSAGLIGSFNWSDDNVDGMKTVETPETLWGEGKSDESKALEENKFEMRKCFLAKVPGKKGTRKRRPRKRSGKKEGEKGENGKAAENGEKKAEAAKASS